MKNSNRIAPELGQLHWLAGLMALLLFAQVLAQDFQEEFDLSARKLRPSGVSRYFILMPGFQTVLASSDTRLTITVLNQTKEIGGVLTRVVEEREEVGGALAEVARNFFAIDPASGDVFYFGEEVDFYQDGKVVNHNGSWIAYQGDNKPGLIVPGNPKVGLKYYQELAPEVALDRAEVISVSRTLTTPAGQLSNCFLTRETSSLEPVTEYKTYAPGIGLVQDQALKLVSYGYKR